MSQARTHHSRKFSKYFSILAATALLAGCVPGEEKPGDCASGSRDIASVLGFGGSDKDAAKKVCDTGGGGSGGGGTTPTPKPYPFPANPGKVCTVDRFKQPEVGDEVIKKVDILFVMDHSGSMADDWARVAGNVKNMVKEFPKDLDIRYAVLLANGSSWKGKLFAPAGIPTVLSNQKLSVNEISDKLGKIFKSGMDQPDNIGSGEASFLSLYHAATTHARDNQKAGFFRADAALSVLFMSDEHEIGSSFPNPQAPGLAPRCDAAFEDKVKLEQYDNKGINLAVGYNALKALKGDMPVITHAFVNITKEDLYTHNDKKAKCLYDSLGYGYFEAVELTKGVLFSIQADKAEGMSRCGKVIKERLQVLHDFKLSKTAEKVDAASIVAAVDGVKQTHEYRAAANNVHLEYAGVPGSTVEIQHCEPVTKVDWNLIGFAGQAGQYAVSLSFKTPEYATTSKVLYGTSASNLNRQTANGARGTDHVATVEGLNPNTLYYFQAVASDEYGVEKRSSVISLRTQPDWNVIGAAGQPSRNTISIAWKTPEYATRGKVLWGANSNALVNQTTETASANEHVAQVSGLNADTTYYFQCVSRDEYGLEKKSAVLAVKTVTDWGIVGFRGQAGQTTASLEWQTPEYPTAGRVLYGTNSGNLNLSAAASGTNVHQVNLAGLSPNTVYYFQAVGIDDLGSEKRSAVIALKTQADWNIVGFAGTATQDSVTVSWTTPEYDTVGTVRYGATAEALSTTVSAGNGIAHSATVGSLSPDTVYYFQAVGVDEYGLTKASAVVAVRTEKKPEEPQPLPVWEISDFGTVASKSTIAVAWKTSDYSTVGKVLYGTDASNLNGEESEVTAVRDHGLEIAGLRADTLYYVQAVSVDDRGQEKRTAVTAVRTLADETPEEPPVGNWAIEGFDASTTATAADVIWHTPGAVTKATIKVGLSANDLTFKEVAVENFAETHLFPVSGLAPNTAYYMQVVAVDKAGRTQESVLIMKRTKAQ